MKKPVIILVDDHDIFRDGLKSLLINEDIADVVAEAANGQQFLELLPQNLPDVVLMDIAMPVMDGVEATYKALELYPDLKILALSMFGEEEYYYKMIHAGVKGFVLKSSGIHELEKAINTIINNENYFSNELLQQIIINVEQKTTDSTKIGTLFSDQEITILKEICNGVSYEETIKKLNLTTQTAKQVHANLLEKTGCKNSASLVMYAIRNKIIQV